MQSGSKKREVRQSAEKKRAQVESMLRESLRLVAIAAAEIRRELGLVVENPDHARVNAKYKPTTRKRLKAIREHLKNSQEWARLAAEVERS